VADVKYLSSASFPVLKMRSSEDFGSIKIDVTFLDHNGEKCVHLIREYGAKYPALLPLTLVLKQVVYFAGLNDPYLVGSLGRHLLLRPGASNCRLLPGFGVPG